LLVLVALTCLSLGYFWDRLWGSRLAFYQDGAIQNLQTRLSVARPRVGPIDRSRSRDLSDPGAGLNPLPRYRVLFLGTSQTWGEGATRKEDVWTQTAVQKLNDRFTARASFSGTNAAMPGSTLPLLISSLERRGLQQGFDLVVINLGTNDGYGPPFRETLLAYCAKLREAGSSVLLILEPNDIEADDELLRHKHEMMIEVAQRLKLPILDMHEYLGRKEVYDSGLIWWDHVHLSSFGNRLFSDRLVDFVGHLLSHRARRALP
jgi:lysophospholipase L1-like esterase